MKKKQENNAAWLQARLQEENITAPEALSEEAVKARLAQGTRAENIIPLKPNRKRAFKRVVSVAAAFAVVVVSLTAVKIYDDRRVKPMGNTNEGIISFSNYQELENLLDERMPEQSSFRFYGLKSLDGTVVMNESAAETATTGATASTYSETYKQVEAVDEADIVKTDGSYIYYINESGDKLLICKAESGETATVATITPEDKECRFCEFFISGNSLVVIGVKTDYRTGFATKDNSYSFITVYDVENKENPEKTEAYRQSGYYQTSRMVDDCVYLISNYYNFSKKWVIPCAVNDDGEYEKLAIEDICAVEDNDNCNYTVVGAMNIQSGKHSRKNTKAVLGAATEVYCNENNLYLTADVSDNARGGAWSADGIYHPETALIKIQLQQTDIKMTASGKVEGYLNNQFSMDEYSGFFRVATTTYGASGEDMNTLFVLDKNLKKVSRLDNFAKNEHIEAVRFLGDTAYVITFERTDPLFVIDLSDPKTPTITGEVKIEGFSQLLVPIDDNTLLGIGSSVADTEFGGVAVDGVKLALFDISDKSKPRVLDEKVVDGATSFAQSTHKALLENKAEQYYAIPLDVYDDNDDYDTGVLRFSVKENKLQLENHYRTPVYVDRCLSIGKTIYAVSAYEEEIYSFE